VKAGLMTRNEFAAAMGVNKSTVSRWISNGRISLDDKGLIDPDAARRSLSATESPEPHHQARKARIEANKAAADLSTTEDGDLESKEALAMRMKRAMAKEREAKAELAAMELDRQAGLLLERAEVDFVMKDIGAALRSALEAMPDRLAPVVAAHRGDVNAVHASLEDAMHTLLHEISGHLTRRAKEVAS